MHSLQKVLDEKIIGLHYGNRVLLPFSADILKVVFGHEIITDFNGTKHGASYSIKDNFTEVYFYDLRSLYEDLGKFETVKMTIVETGKDIFDFKNHITLSVSPKDRHGLNIEKLDENILYFE